jgi:3-hydroxybutyrate dehydrogenase
MSTVMPSTPRRALVTGGGRGIGRAIALRLAGAGYGVVVTGRTRVEIDAVAAETGGVAVAVDLADRADVARAVAEIGERAGVIDVLVNNAGIAESAPAGRTSDAVWDRAMAVNATAPFLLARAFLPAMIAQGWGRIVNVASNAGLTGYAYTAAYCASKHALIGLTRALAAEVATTGVTVNAVCPGFVDTQMTDEAVARIVGKTGRAAADARAALEALSPQKRLMTVGEVAHAVLSLLPDEARGIHGQAIVIDGGQVLW